MNAVLNFFIVMIFFLSIIIIGILLYFFIIAYLFLNVNIFLNGEYCVVVYIQFGINCHKNHSKNFNKLFKIYKKHFTMSEFSGIILTNGI